MCAYALPKYYILYFILLKNQMLWLVISFRCNFKFSNFNSSVLDYYYVKSHRG